jgi:hypothetical protein
MSQKNKMDEENSRLRDLMANMHASFMDMLNFNVHLREQIRRNLYFDPPSGVSYGIHTRSVATQTPKPEKNTQVSDENASNPTQVRSVPIRR